MLRPSAVRVLLTGQADMAAAIKVINEGQIFRFLTKPCAPDQFMSVAGRGNPAARLIAAERLLLQRTLVGTVKALTEIMALMSPAAMGRAQRLRRRVASLAARLHLEDRWQLEDRSAVVLSGTYLSTGFSDVQALSGAASWKYTNSSDYMMRRRAANRLIGHVPRLEPVSALLNALQADQADTESPGAVDAVQAAVLRLAVEVERLEGQSLGQQAILEWLQASGDYPADLLRATREVLTEQRGLSAHAEVSIQALAIGMVLDEDIKTARDVLIAPRGCEVTASFLEHIRHFTTHFISPLCRCCWMPISWLQRQRKAWSWRRRHRER